MIVTLACLPVQYEWRVRFEQRDLGLVSGKCPESKIQTISSPTRVENAANIGGFILPIVMALFTTLGNVLETPTPTTRLKSTAVRLQFVRQYATHLYRRTFLASKLQRKGSPAIRLPFVLQYASHLYGSAFVRQHFWKNTGGWGHRNVSEI